MGHEVFIVPLLRFFLYFHCTLNIIIQTGFQEKIVQHFHASTKNVVELKYNQSFDRTLFYYEKYEYFWPKKITITSVYSKKLTITLVYLKKINSHISSLQKMNDHISVLKK